MEHLLLSAFNCCQFQLSRLRDVVHLALIGLDHLRGLIEDQLDLLELHFALALCLSNTCVGDLFVSVKALHHGRVLVSIVERFETDHLLWHLSDFSVSADLLAV